MYNRYLAAAEQTAPETSQSRRRAAIFSGLGRTLNARLQGVRLDMDNAPPCSSCGSC